NPGIAFAGDANPGAPQLSPVATYEGKLAAANLLGGGAQVAVDYRSVPHVVFAIPTLAAVGMMEDEARRAGLPFEVKANDMADWRSTRMYAERAAWAKILIAKDDDRILGAHMVGHGAAELVHAFAFAMRFGVTATTLRDTIFAYPT